MTRSSKKTTPKKAKGKKKNGLIARIRQGRSLSLDFFVRNAWFFLFFTVAVVALIGLRYSTQSKMVQIQHLQTELDRTENEKIEMKAKYMSLIRETEMSKLVKSRNLDLDFQEQPPYRISRSDKAPAENNTKE